MKNHGKPQCANCKKHVPFESHFCLYCGREIKRDKKFRDTYATWRVTTEGDCEGRSTVDLGTFEGHIDEIAKALANRCYYSLHFSTTHPVNQIPDPERVPKQVSVQLDIQSNTWNMSMAERAEAMALVLKDRPVSVKKGQYYASFVIEFND